MQSLREIVAQKREEWREQKIRLGDWFEELTRYFLRYDPKWSTRLQDVQFWSDSELCDGHDRGIDLVAKDREDDTYWAIQCKCCDPEQSLSLRKLSTTLAVSRERDGQNREFKYGHLLIVHTSEAPISNNLAKSLEGWSVQWLGLEELESSALDWSLWSEGRGSGQLQAPKAILPHQREALQAVRLGFETSERGKLIMACGTGKTFTSLQIAQDLVGEGLVLFVAPSIALVAQTLRAWANDCSLPFHPLVVCSDPKAGTRSKGEADWDLKVAETFPATTDLGQIAAFWRRHGAERGLKVIFSTYQSLGVVAAAQAEGFLPTVALAIADEAHRTTGIWRQSGSADLISPFTLFHDSTQLRAQRRLYMTATPRLYSETAKSLAEERELVLASMDNEETFGPEFYRLTFGEAVERGLLCDYRVLILRVPQQAAQRAVQELLASDDEGRIGELDVSMAVRIVGAWQALATRGLGSNPSLERVRAALSELEWAQYLEAKSAGSPYPLPPLTKVLAFCSNIKRSKGLVGYFARVQEKWLKGLNKTTWPLLRCSLAHVDGTQNSAARQRTLRWLEGLSPRPAGQEGREVALNSESRGPECKIISNVRCLGEGVDVPSLDALLFVDKRQSKVDIAQAVGRVMRTAPGKRYGYIILPVVIPDGHEAGSILEHNEDFEIVWEVLRALRSHDERLAAEINALRLDKERTNLKEGGEGHIYLDDGDGLEEFIQGRLEFDWQETAGLIYSALVDKVGDREYWADWAADVSGLAQRYQERLHSILENNLEARSRFDKFLEGLRHTITPTVDEEQALNLLAQHLITKPVLEALLGQEPLTKSNPVSMAIEEMVTYLQSLGWDNLGTPEERQSLERVYESVKLRAQRITSPAGRQELVKKLYENFFTKAFKKMAEKLGIVYTPQEVIDYILYGVEALLEREFDCHLADPGVNILDPFTGTGSFVVSLLENSQLLPDSSLEYKYQNELWANEIVLLAYYVAMINIESAYHARLAASKKEEPLSPEFSKQASKQASVA